MPADQSTWRKRRTTLWPFLLAGTITWCSGFPAAVPDADWIQPDKLGHLAAYGALATAIVRHPAAGRWSGMGLWWALVLASGYGLGDEFRQSLTHGVRSPDWHDWVADTIGAVLATSLYIRWTWYRQLMEMPIFRRKKPPEEVPGNKEQATGEGSPVPSDK